MPGAGGFVTTNSISLTGLTPDTSYTLQVTSVDAVAGEAPISGSHTILTCESLNNGLFREQNKTEVESINFYIFFSVTNECAAGTDNCDDNAICTNNDISFTCACKTGYTGDGITCQRKYISKY